LRGVKDRIRSQGADLVVVGNGRPEQAAEFAREENLDFPLLVDPDMEAYRAAGLKHGIVEAVSLKTVGHAIRALGKGFRQKKVQGDPWQLGGTFVISPEGKTLFRHVSSEAGDHPNPNEVLSVL